MNINRILLLLAIFCFIGCKDNSTSKNVDKNKCFTDREIYEASLFSLSDKWDLPFRKTDSVKASEDCMSAFKLYAIAGESNKSVNIYQNLSKDQFVIEIVLQDGLSDKLLLKKTSMINFKGIRIEDNTLFVYYIKNNQMEKLCYGFDKDIITIQRYEHFES